MGKNSKKIVFYLFFLVQIAVLLLPNPLLSAGEVVLNSPTTGCTNGEAWVNLSWTWNDIGSPTFHILRQMEGESGYTDIGQTVETYYIDNFLIISDKYYDYQIKAVRGTDEFYSEVERADGAYCPPEISSIAADCKPNDPPNEPHIDLSWHPVSGDLSTYNIWRAKDGSVFSLVDSTTDTSYSDGPNIAGTSLYEYFIEAVWQDTNSSSSKDIADQKAPACYPALSANIRCETGSAPGGPQVDLSWNNLLGVDYYQIYRKALSESKWIIPTGAENITDTSYTDELVESLSDDYDQEGNISYYVKAVWEGEAERNSSEEQVTLPRCAPFLTVGTNCDDAVFRLSWTATQNADYYFVYLDGEYSETIYGLSATSAPSDCSTGGSCTHSYQVSAICAGGGNPWSNLVEKTMDCASYIPPSPAPVLNDLYEYCEAGNSKIDISWSESENVIYYGLWRNNNEILITANYFYTDPGVQMGYDYDYWVRAYGQGELYTDSDNNVTTTAVGCDSPSTPSISLSPGCDEGVPYVTVSWSETTDTFAYEIYRGLVSDNLILVRTFKIGSPGFQSRTWDDTSVSASIRYYYKVVSVGAPGVDDSESDVSSIVAPSCDPTLPILTLSNSCNGSSPMVDLTWTTDEANTIRYDIFRADYESGSKPIKTIFNTSIKDWSDDSVSPATSYNYKVEAIGHLGQIATEGYKPPITTYICLPPGGFVLTDDNVYCNKGAYPWSGLVWTDSDYVNYYDLERNLYSGDTIIDTKTMSDTESPFIDRGFGNALSYGGWNDYVTFGTPDSLDFGASTDFSLSFWVKFNSYPGSYKDFIGKMYPGYQVGFGSSHNLRFYIVDTSGHNRQVYSSFVPDLGEWYHIAFVADRDGDVVLYANGNEIGRGSISHIGDLGNSVSDPLKVGDVLDDVVNCTVDEFRIYARVLPVEEIQQHYGGVYESEADVRGIWHFDEGSGGSVSDASDYCNNGTINGGLTWVEVGPQSGEKYSWQSIAHNEVGSTRSNLTTPVTSPVCSPSKPGLCLSQTCDTGVPGVEISWSFAINTETYNLYRDSAPPIESFSSGDPEFSSRHLIDDDSGTGLTPEQNYTYWIESVGSTSLATESNHRIIEAPDCSTSTGVINLAAIWSCDDHRPKVDLSWNSLPDILYYKILRNSSLLATTTAISYIDDYPSVEVNNTYVYKIVPHVFGGDGVPSDPITMIIDYCLPSQPVIDYLTTKCENFAPVSNLGWSDDTDFNTVNYAIYRNDTGSPPVAGDLIGTTAAFSWEDNDISLLSNVLYYYWVEAISYIPNSDVLSARESINTYNCNWTPDEPTNLSVITNCCGNDCCNTLTWDNSLNAVSHNVFRVNPDTTVSALSTRLSPLLDKGDFALEFDNSVSGDGDEASIPDSSSLQISDSSSPSFSLESWINLSTGNSYDYFMGDINGCSSNAIGIGSSATNMLRFKGDFSENGTRVYHYNNGPAINEGEWTHVVFVWDKENNSERWYVGGSMVDEVGIDDDCEYLWAGGSSFKIGSGYWSWEGFDGKVDEARIYGRALNDDEVLDHFNGIYNNEIELRGAWHFDEGEGSSVLDSSGNGNNGSISIVTDNSWFSRSSLENGEDYTYYVKAYGVGKESDPSNNVTVTNEDCGPVITSFNIVGQCDGANPQIYLSWTANNYSYTNVYKKREEEPEFLIAAPYFPQNDFVDDNVESGGVVYEYRIVVVGDDGSDDMSDVETTTAPICVDAPAIPVVTLTPTCLGTSRNDILVGWTEDLGGNTLSYEIWGATSGPFALEYLDEELASETDYSYRHTGLAPLTEYKYQVVAKGSATDNPSEIKATSTYDCANWVPLPPPHVDVSPGYPVSEWDPGTEEFYQAVSLVWSDCYNEEEFKIYRRLTGSALWGEAIATTNMDIVAYIDYGVSEDLDYDYRVEAENVNGTTTSGNILTVHIPIAAPSPPKLSITWTGEVADPAKLTWTEASSTPAGMIDPGVSAAYIVEKDDKKEFTTTQVCKIEDGSLSCIDPSPNIAEPYYRVRAINNGGETISNIVELFPIIPRTEWREIIPR